MRIVDSVLPAARYLVEPGAIGALRPPVESAGGRIESVRVVHLQYRPGSDVVVRYSAMVSWDGAPAVRETLAASATADGPLPGTIPVVADSPSGPLSVGVWRWPFDPVLVGLASVTTPADVAALLGLDAVGLDVVAYRPTERAVVRVTTGDTVAAYLKIVRPEATRPIVDRHVALLDGGVPAPAVTGFDPDLGVIAMAPLVGPTWRELIKADRDGWPTIDAIDDLTDRFSAAAVDAPARASHLIDGPRHAAMLATVVPELGDRLDALAERITAAPPAPADGTVHGDLHEGQLVVDAERITGVVDVDEVGRGASIDDRANLLARLLFRQTTNARSVRRLDSFRRELRAASASRFDLDALDLHTAAALLGLATGPFRLQSDDWRTTVDRLVAHSEFLTMRTLSADPHPELTVSCAR